MDTITGPTLSNSVQQHLIGTSTIVTIANIANIAILVDLSCVEQVVI